MVFSIFLHCMYFFALYVCIFVHYVRRCMYVDMYEGIYVCSSYLCYKNMWFLKFIAENY